MPLKAVIQGAGKTADGVVIAADFVAALGPSRHPAVRVTVGDYTFRTSVGSMGGVFMLPITAETRSRTGLAAGDEVDFEIELDLQPRAVQVPEDLTVALDGGDAARASFDPPKPNGPFRIRRDSSRRDSLRSLSR